MRIFAMVAAAIFVVAPCLASDADIVPERSSSVAGSALNLVFCPLNYQDAESFQRDLDLCTQRLIKTRPFEGFRDSIRMWRVWLGRETQGILFRSTDDFPPVKVREDFLRGISRSLGAPYKLVLIDATGFVSCAEVSSINAFSVIVLGKAGCGGSDDFTGNFLHEIGHSLGLRDEGANCGSARCPPGPPNCAVSKEQAEEWWGALVGVDPAVNYIGGCCGNKDYLRPTLVSLMGDARKAEDFGPVNERYLKACLGGKNK